MKEYDCTLWSLLKLDTTCPVPISTRLNLLKTIVETVIFIQSKNFCHLDLKPGNIFLNKNPNGTWNGHDLVVADFGLSTAFNELKGQAGTPGFGAPEQFLGKPSRKSDNFAMGKMAVLILFKWQTGWNLLASPLTPTTPDYINHLPQVRRIISELLNVSINNFHVETP